jgi:hypothetical protein
MPQVGFEPTIPVFERAKIVLALDLAENRERQWNELAFFELHLSKDTPGTNNNRVLYLSVTFLSYTRTACYFCVSVGGKQNYRYSLLAHMVV